MRMRITIAGIVAGVLCFLPLRFIYYNLEPAQYVQFWPDAAQAAQYPTWMETAILIFCGVILFVFGWIAARWNWAGNWRSSLLSGAGSGLLAGCLLFDFIGVFHYGLQAQSEVLMNYSNPLTELEGMRILLEAVFKTGTSLYLNFMRIVLNCTGLGALGGLSSALIDVQDFWGREPRRPDGWLFRLNAYLLAILGVVNLVVTIAVLQTLWEKALDTTLKYAEQYNLQFGSDFTQILFLPAGYLVGMISILLPVSFTWGWIYRTWRKQRRPGVLSGLWVLVTGGGVLYALYNSIKTAGSFPLDIYFGLIPQALVLVIGVVLGLMMEDRSAGDHLRFSDWLGFGLGYGILGGTQIMMGTVAYAVSLVLITIENIPHLTTTGMVTQNPTEQVRQLFSFQSKMAGAAISSSLIIGLILAGLVSFIRRIFKIKESNDEQPQVTSESIMSFYE
jgi:hypothetical protein